MKKDSDSLLWVFSRVKYIAPYLLLLAGIGIVVGFLSAELALVSKRLIDAAAASSADGLLRAGTSLFGLLAALLVLQIAYSKAGAYASGKLNVSLRNEAFERLLSKDYTSVTQYHSAELVSRISSDTAQIASFVTGTLPNGLALAAKMVFSLLVLFSLDPAFAMLCLLVLPLALAVAQLYKKKTKALYKKSQSSEEKTYSFMQECLQNLLVIKSFTAEASIVKTALSLQNETYRYQIKRNNLSIAANIMFYAAVTFIYYFALAWAAVKLAKGIISFGTLTAMLQLTGQIQSPLRDLSSVLPQFFGTAAAAERLIELSRLEEDVPLNPPPEGPQSAYATPLEIVLRDVSFSYGRTKVLDSAQLRIEKGELIAFTGSSGIGKSTFLKLLLGMIQPDGGQITIRLEGGTVLFPDKLTRSLFSYVPQRNMILSGSIRDNISFTNKTEQDDRVIECARIAQIWDFIQSLPQGLDTVLGENGLGLSEGQIQRLAIARALHKGAPVLLLDEATSALDEETELAVLQNIRRLQSCTCLIVSHRRAVSEICDRTILLQNGKFRTES